MTTKLQNFPYTCFDICFTLLFISEYVLLNVQTMQVSLLMCVLQIITYMAVDKEMELKGEKRYISFGKTMMQALELIQLAKRYISRRSNVEQ